MDTYTKLAEWVRFGVVREGECPQCGKNAVVIREFEYSCSNCSFEGEFESPPGWI